MSRVHDERPPQSYDPGDFGKYQGTWFVRGPTAREAVMVRDVITHGASITMTVPIGGWILIHGGWRRA